MDESKLKILRDEGYEFISEIIEKRGHSIIKYMNIKHLLCGKIYKVRVSKFFSEGQRCMCLRKRKNAKIKSTQDYQNFLDEKFGKSEYQIVGEYIGRKHPITLKHKCRSYFY